MVRMIALLAAGQTNLTVEEMPATFELFARDQFKEPYQMMDLASHITRLSLWPSLNGAIVESSSAPGYAKVKVW
jgi:hypothetical protein